MDGTDENATVRKDDLWAWTVSFVVTLGLHIGIVLFIALSAAMAIYVIAITLSDTSGIQILAWISIVLSLLIWASLVKLQVRGLGPHLIRGLGEPIATSGCSRGEIAADIGTALIGLAQIIPLIVTLVCNKAVPAKIHFLTALAGGLLLILGVGSLALRLRLRHARATRQESNAAP